MHLIFVVLRACANCEHVGLLLRGCPQLRILATSREPLGIGVEAVLRVPPLAVPDPDRRPSLRVLPKYEAVTLFAERAATAVPGFALTEDNAVAEAGICHRLDGLPLPIELAAARLRAMSPGQILQRLTDRCALLTRGSRGAPTRQQTLRLCIDWSFELCTSGEQLVWGRLAAFAGSVELDAAERVCGADLAPGELLDNLWPCSPSPILPAGPHYRTAQGGFGRTLTGAGSAPRGRPCDPPVSGAPAASAASHVDSVGRHRVSRKAAFRFDEAPWALIGMYTQGRLLAPPGSG